MFNITPIVRNLLIINLVVFLLPYLLSFFVGFEPDFGEMFGLRSFLSTKFEAYQIITHFFVHSGFWHLASNMFALVIFGPMLEYSLGGKRFLTFYMICGFGASILYSIINQIELFQFKMLIDNFLANSDPYTFSELVLKSGLKGIPKVMDGKNFMIDLFALKDELIMNPNNTKLFDESKEIAALIFDYKANTPMVGASGAVFGILMGFALLFPNVELMLLFPPIPVKAKYLVAFYALYEFYSILQNAPDDNVAHFAHLGGMLFAYILLRIWRNQL